MSGTLQSGCRFAFGPALVLGLALFLCPALAQGQPGGPSPARGERDPFFDAMRQVYRELTPNRELMELLWHEEVRTEIHLSKEHHQQIENSLGTGFQQVIKLHEEAVEQNQKLSKDEWIEKILAIQKPVDAEIMEMLSNSEVADLDRLVGIYVQLRGYRSAANAVVAKRIDLTGDDFEAYRRARGEYWHRLMDEHREQMGGLIRGGDRKKIAKLFEEIDQKLDSQLASLLTSAQKSALQNLKGAKFEIEGQPLSFRGRGGGGSPRGSNGRRGDGNRGDDGSRDRQPPEGKQGQGTSDCRKSDRLVDCCRKPS